MSVPSTQFPSPPSDGIGAARSAEAMALPSGPGDRAGHRTGARAARRVMAGLVLAGATTLLSVAAWLQPDPTGVGTHEQLGLPTCGWIHAAGIPCPTCGMTTSFALAADGRVLSALWCQPAGAVLALATASAGLLAAVVLVTGASIGPVVGRLRSGVLWWLLGALILGAWSWKIAILRGWL